MRISLIALAFACFMLNACSDKKEDTTAQDIQGAWTLNSQEQQGVSVPASKPKDITEFGSSTAKTMQIEIVGQKLKIIETDFVQVFVTEYTFTTYESKFFLVSAADPNVKETIPYEYSNDVLVLHTADGKRTFTKTTQQNLATKTAVAVKKTQMVDLHFFVSLPGSTVTPLEIPSTGVAKGIQTANDSVTLKCSYDHQKKQATVVYSNIQDSPDTLVNMTFGLDFDLASKNENTLFTSLGQVQTDLYGKKITGVNSNCAGSMVREEFYVQIDMRCTGLTINDDSGSSVDLSGKIKCLF